MARSPSEAGFSSAPALPVSEFGPAWAGRARPLWAAIALAAVGVAAYAAQAAGADHGKIFAAAGGAAALLLGGVLFVLHRQQAAAAAGASSWEQRARQAQQQAEDLGRQVSEQEARARALMTGLAEAADRLLYVRLPAVLDGGGAAPADAGGGPAGNDEAAALFARVGDLVEAGAVKLREEADELRQRADDHRESSRRAVLTLARLLQASALRIQAQAAKMAEDRPADLGVLEASMRVEHAAAQMARNAQSLVVLCGEWPGQQWPDPLALTDVARAGAGRIVSYERVNVSGDHDVAADAGVVEPLIHLVAELLANATQSSPPAARVEVTVQAVQHGAVIEIDDRGIGMEEAQFRTAQDILSGRRLVGLGDLGEFPQTGLAVIGHYVDRHGFGVELKKSPYGGVRAIVLVPDALVVSNLEPARVTRPVLPQPRHARADVREPAEANGARRLARRQSLRGQALPGAHDVLSPADPAGETTPEEDGAFLAAYLGGGEVAGGPDADAIHTAENDTDLPDGTER